MKWDKDIRTGTKKLYVQFYKEIQEIMETLQDDKNIEGKYYLTEKGVFSLIS
jgi:hypothetical protein